MAIEPMNTFGELMALAQRNPKRTRMLAYALILVNFLDLDH